MAIELAIEDLFPRPEIELALGDRDNHFAAHDLPLEVCVRVVFACAVVVVVVRVRIEGRERFKPLTKIVMKPMFVVVDED